MAHRSLARNSLWAATYRDQRRLFRRVRSANDRSRASLTLSRSTWATSNRHNVPLLYISIVISLSLCLGGKNIIFMDIRFRYIIGFCYKHHLHHLHHLHHHTHHCKTLYTVPQYTHTFMLLVLLIDLLYFSC